MLMIYTVTLNPSLDYIAFTDAFRKGSINRTKKEMIFPGGKGINVSQVLAELGVDSTILGFCAGFTGNEIKRLLKEKGLSEDLTTVTEGLSRINVKIHAEEETELNGMGPFISSSDEKALLMKMEALGSGDVIILSGSIPSSMGRDIYKKIATIANGKGVMLIADCEGDLLEGLLPYRPFLVKPNHIELGDLFGVKVESREDAALYAGKLIAGGACNVLVSMAGSGAVLVTEDGKVFVQKAPSGTVINSVGAGDASLAGFVYGYLEAAGREDDERYKTALSYAVACGSASAFSEGFPEREKIEKIRRETV